MNFGSADHHHHHHHVTQSSHSMLVVLMDLLSLWSVVLCFFSLCPMSLSLAPQTSNFGCFACTSCSRSSMKYRYNVGEKTSPSCRPRSHVKLSVTWPSTVIQNGQQMGRLDMTLLTIGCFTGIRQVCRVYFVSTVCSVMCIGQLQPCLHAGAGSLWAPRMHRARCVCAVLCICTATANCVMTCQ
jgi:hypothetical protein